MYFKNLEVVHSESKLIDWQYHASRRDMVPIHIHILEHSTGRAMQSWVVLVKKNSLLSR